MFYLDSHPGQGFLDGDFVGVVNVLHGFFIFIPWLAFALKCPTCKRAILWYIMRKGEQRDFVKNVMLATQGECPACKMKYSEMDMGAATFTRR